MNEVSRMSSFSYGRKMQKVFEMYSGAWLICFMHHWQIDLSVFPVSQVVWRRQTYLLCVIGGFVSPICNRNRFLNMLHPSADLHGINGIQKMG